MRYFVLLLLFPVCLCGSAFCQGAEFNPFLERPGVLEFSGQMIARPLQVEVLIATGLSHSAAVGRHEAASARLDSLRIDYETLNDEHILRVPEGHNENSLAALLMATGDYQYVEPDWICYPIGTVPNDPSYGQQWHHSNMDSAEAWDIFTGDISRIAATVDTGVDKSHPDLQAHFVLGYNSADRIPESQGGNVNDVNGHGTMTIGCVGAIGNNGIGVAGVNWNISLMPIRTTNSSSGSATMSDLNNGTLWAAKNGATTISVSYTGVQSSSVQTTGAQAKALGALVVWAADNNNTNHSGFDWPDVIIAGATDQGDNKASFSSYGLAIDVMAPGVDVMTTKDGGSYQAVSGTSFSAPLTNGVCALIWGYAPNLTPNEVEQVLFDGCDDLGSSALYGHGRINSFNSLSLSPLIISFPSGLPEGLLSPGPAPGFEVTIQSGGENYVPGTGFVHYRYQSGSYSSVALTPLGGGLFEALLPATAPGDKPQFFLTADGDGGTTVSSPVNAPVSTYSFEVGFGELLLADDFETDMGWTVTSQNLLDGEWERGVPAGGGARGDPPTDADGSGKCFVTDNVAGNSDVDGGPTIVTSPAIDLSSGDARVGYSIWFYNDDTDDPFKIEVSNNNGSSWTQVSNAVGGAGGWSQASFKVGDYLSPTEQVKVRFSATDNPNNSVTEAGLDAVRIERIVTDPGLWASAYSVEASPGSNVPLFLDVGASYGGRQYVVLGSFAGTSPGTILPGGALLPLNQDWLFNFILGNLGSPLFQGFAGTLDGAGTAGASLNVPAGVATPYAGTTISLAYTLYGAFDYVSNPIGIAIVP